MDVSSAQPRDLTALIQAHAVEHVVCKLYQSIENIPWTCSAEQLASAQANGCSVGGYVWLYHDVDTAAQVRDALETARLAGVTLPILWLDLETYEGEAPTLAEALAAVAEAHRLAIPVGVYTGNWFVRDYWGGEVGELAALPVWLADYNGRPDLDTPTPYWPAELVLGHQYSADGIDLDVFDASVT